jgi:hypothetical protein
VEIPPAGSTTFMDRGTTQTWIFFPFRSCDQRMTYALHEFFDPGRVSDLIRTFDSQSLFSPGCGQHMKIFADPLPNVCPRYLLILQAVHCQSHYFTPLLSTLSSTTPAFSSLGFSISHGRLPFDEETSMETRRKAKEPFPRHTQMS